MRQKVYLRTGLVVTLDTGREGPHIALRADIDELPRSLVEEAFDRLKKYVFV